MKLHELLGDKMPKKKKEYTGYHPQLDCDIAWKDNENRAWNFLRKKFTNIDIPIADVEEVKEEMAQGMWDTPYKDLGDWDKGTVNFIYEALQEKFYIVKKEM